jgi:hypothetical protein
MKISKNAKVVSRVDRKQRISWVMNCQERQKLARLSRIVGAKT